jgi:hypothetical protein
VTPEVPSESVNQPLPPTQDESTEKEESAEVGNAAGNDFFGLLDPRLTYLMQKKAACDAARRQRSPRQRSRSPQSKGPEAKKTNQSLAELAAQVGAEPETIATNARQGRLRAGRAQAKQRQELQGSSDDVLIKAVRAVAEGQTRAEVVCALDAAFTQEWREKLAVELDDGDETDSFKRGRDEASKLRLEGASYGVAMPGRSKMRFRLDVDAHMQGTAQPRFKKDIVMEPAQTTEPRRTKPDRSTEASGQAGKTTGFWKRLGSWQK